MRTLQQQAHLWQLNSCVSLWFPQMCICGFYFPSLLRLANDVETTPVDQHSGPMQLSVFTVHACRCKTLHLPFGTTPLLLDSD